MEDHALFYDELEHALRAVITALGGARKVGAALFLDKGSEAAAIYLSNCTDSTRPEKLSLGQVMWLLRKGREAGCHAAIDFICAETGYEAPRPRDPADEMSELQRAYIESVRLQQRITSRLEKLASSDALRTGPRAVSNG